MSKRRPLPIERSDGRILAASAARNTETSGFGDIVKPTEVSFLLAGTEVPITVSTPI